jgi:succinate dehydrogenase / fumarate reductase cytochrome b subunit
MTIYRLPLTAKLSILHRITGMGMIPGAVLVVWWFVAGAYSPQYFATADWLLTSWVGLLVMTGSLWALWYHFANGIRHLIWDTGRALDIPTAEKLGWACIFGSVVLTILTVVVI